MAGTQSAGILLYRKKTGPKCCSCKNAANFGRPADDGNWSIPKGEFDASESAEAGPPAPNLPRRPASRSPPS